MQVDTQFVQGLAELDATLKSFPPKLAKKALRRAMSQGGKVFQDEMKRTAPRRIEEPTKREFGPLWKHIRRSLRFDARAGTVRVKVGPSAGKGGVAFYARFYEFGTSRQPPRPWLRPLFDRMKQKSLNVIVTELRSKTEQIAKERSVS